VTAAEEGREPRYDFPADELTPDGRYDVAFDMHTSIGSGKNRGYGHFLVHSSRTDSMTDLEQLYKSINMELVEQADDTDAEFTETELDHALSPANPDALWREPNFEQETFGSE
jgi:hypothetical protein